MYQTDFLPSFYTDPPYLIQKNEILNNSYFRLDSYREDSNFTEIDNVNTSLLTYFFIISDGFLNEDLSNVLILTERQNIIAGNEYKKIEYFTPEFLNYLKDNNNAFIYIAVSRPK